jgi:predicted PurR-regulated permease PerM
MTASGAHQRPFIPTIVFIGMVMVAGKTDSLRFTRRLVPPDRLPLFDTMRAAVARSFGGFIRGQFGLAAVYGLLVSGIAIVFGVPFVPDTADRVGEAIPG